jgi:hypothetical protein
MNFKKTGKIMTNTFVGTGPSYYKKRIYRAAVSQRLRNTAVEKTEPKFRLHTGGKNIFKPLL